MKGSRKSMVAYSKQAERDVAEKFGGRRLSSGEWQGKGDIDVLVTDQGEGIAIQVKQSAGTPKYLLEGMDQVRDAVKDVKELEKMGINYDLLPIMVIKTKPGQGKEGRMFVVIEVEDWIEHSCSY